MLQQEQNARASGQGDADRLIEKPLARRNTGRPAGRPTSTPPKRAQTKPKREAFEAPTLPAKDNKRLWTQVTYQNRNTAATMSKSVRPPVRKQHRNL